MIELKPRVFSGMQPTGSLHLGNYLGALINWVSMQDTHECIYCVVDLHAITAEWQEPDELRQSIRRAAAAYIASGIDPKKSILFNQSQVHEHAELAWIFNCVARLGWLNRMTQFKEKAGKDRENASVGLYAYPNLMAADILVYRGTHVPGRRGPEAAPRTRARHRPEIQQRLPRLHPDEGLRRSGVLPAARADHPRAGDARHEPARRHEEDVEVGPIRPVAHQPDRRCGRHFAKDPAGEDRSRTPFPPRSRASKDDRRRTI